MSIEHEIIRDQSLLTAYVKNRYGVNVSVLPLQCGTKGITEVGNNRPSGCCLNNGSSAGPLIWITNRLIEQNAFKCGCPTEADDFHCLEVGGGKLRLAAVARSKVFRTNLLPEPIDLTAARVSVCTYYDGF